MCYSTPNAILTKLSIREYSIGDAPYHGENLAEFHVWCVMAHQQGFLFVYITRIDMLILWRVEALQSIKHVDAHRIHGETNVTWWHGSRQSHRDDRAQNIAWICIYNNRLEHIHILEGQELLWLKRVAHVAMKVHHTKCIITHTHAGIYIYIYIYIFTYIHTSCTMLSHKVGK